MSALLKRVEALESRAGDANDCEPMFVRLVAMDADENAEITRIWQGSRDWDRLPDESEEAFMARAVSETTQAPNCAKVFLGS